MKNCKKLLTGSFLGICILANSISPVTMVYANEIPNASFSQKVSNATFYDEVNRVSVEVVNADVLRLTYEDGTIDVLEKKEDGVYKNGVLFVENNSLPSVNSIFRSSGWAVVGVTSDRADRDSVVHNAIGALYSTVLGLVGGGAIGFLIEAIQLATHSNPPGAYSRTTVLYNASELRFKVINDYFRDPYFSQHVKTTVGYVTIPQ
ncbi:hypothetical protein [Streptococcus marmotae]|uniref:hypothetical protein n=1 Tax=Streptococcus marmotae TaxID=1825069 RepID=UPI0008302F70|nr:hypothetical protein [Streptococcus marmotae]